MAAVGAGEAGADRWAPALRPGRAEDAAAAARLHAGQIGDGFLSSLGPRFLELLYRRVCGSASSFLVVAEADGVVVGFVAGSTDTGSLYREFLLHDGLRAALSAPWRLLASWRRVVETLRHGHDGEAADAELLAIAVDPAARGRGVGAALVEALLLETARRGAATVEVVVGADNGPAIALYHGAGFVTGRRFELHPGTSSLVLYHRAATSQ